MTPEEQLLRIAALQRRFINFDTDIKRLWKRASLSPQGYVGTPAAAEAPSAAGPECEGSIYIVVRDADSNVIGTFNWNGTEGYYEDLSFLPYLHLRYEFSGPPGTLQTGSYIIKDPNTLCESDFSASFTRPLDCTTTAVLPNHAVGTNGCGFGLDPYVEVQQYPV